jgi:hypothetical protein
MVYADGSLAFFVSPPCPIYLRPLSPAAALFFSFAVFSIVFSDLPAGRFARRPPLRHALFLFLFSTLIRHDARYAAFNAA